MTPSSYLDGSTGQDYSVKYFFLIDGPMSGTRSLREKAGGPGYTVSADCRLEVKLESETSSIRSAV